jgi:hypothetical protein
MIALCLPLSSHANAGIGFFTVSSPFLLLALAPAILVEAPILSRLLEVSLKRGLWWSLIANLVSTILGAILGVALDILLVVTTQSSGMAASRHGALAALVPTFFLTWWLEQRTIRRLQPAGGPRSVTRATLVANAVSYSLLAAALLFLPAPGLDFPRGEVRMKVTEVLASMGPAKVEVAGHFAAHGRFPEPRQLQATVAYARSLRLETDGRLAVVIRYPPVHEVDGKTVILEPRVEAGRIVEWACYTRDVPHQYLPANCRQGPTVQARGK